ncbi:hypothetical protein J0H58_38170 [bacterium]|nr:hypothetical protein [bacterium]
MPRLGLVRVGEEHLGVVRHIASIGAFIELVEYGVFGILLFGEEPPGHERSRFAVGGALRVVVLEVTSHEVLPGRGWTKLRLRLAEGHPAEPRAAPDAGR